MTNEALTGVLHLIIEGVGLINVLEVLASIVKEESVTLKPEQCDAIATHLELAAEECR